ncbi:MAG: DUF58 domain-containing protein [Candidatus Eisenbacteria sp.]|nr:DUF58 domain-containing protein [Candidatus Eisenbacteria bacterium]
MIPKEILRKVRRIEIQTRHLVNDVFAGEYHSVFKGQGMEFTGVREYEPGDDMRTIDWNVTARLGRPFVKKFQEERELTVVLMVDASGSGRFGSVERMKGEIAAEICALLAFSAIKNNDKVGLLIFTDHVEKFVPPKKGREHVLRVIREILYFEPRGRGTDIELALRHLLRVVKRKAVVFLVSDFLDSDFGRVLKIAARKHDVVAISVEDPRESILPATGFIELEDAETGKRLTFDAGDRRSRAAYEGMARIAREKREKTLSALREKVVNIRTDEPYVEPLVSFFRRRAARLRR